MILLAANSQVTSDGHCNENGGRSGLVMRLLSETAYMNKMAVTATIHTHAISYMTLFCDQLLSQGPQSYRGTSEEVRSNCMYTVNVVGIPISQ